MGLGGIVGGVSTGCTESTRNVFIECAYFHPDVTAKTGRALQIESDARYRFDRGVDPEFVATGTEIAAALVIEICGGEASEIVQAGDVPAWKRMIAFDPAYTKKLAGIDIPEKEQEEILKNLGFVFEGSNVIPPSWRGDIEGKADLVEEVVRIYGYDKINSVSLRADIPVNESCLLYTSPSPRDA